jgi:hypothetical protein
MTAARTPSRRLVFATLAVAALLGSATACGSSGDDDAGNGDVASLDDGSSDASDTTTAGTTAPEDLEDAMLAFTECMRDHGIDMPDPQVTGEGGIAIAVEGEMDDEKFQEAQTACEPLMENARGDIEVDPEQLAEMQAEMLEFAECMREHGIDMPDPVFSDDGRVTQQGPPPGDDGSEFDGDEFNTAADECGRGEGGPMIAAAPSGGDAGSGGPSFSVGDDDGEDGD